MSNSMNKSELAERLFEHFKLRRRNMSKAFAAEVVDAIFGVAPRYTKADARTGPNKASRCDSGSIGRKVDGDDSDGILASHLLKEPDSKVTIPGFGTLSVAKRRERDGRHPSSGKKIIIPETHVITFRAGKSLKTAAAYDLD